MRGGRVRVRVRADEEFMVLKKIIKLIKKYDFKNLLKNKNNI